MSVNINQNVVTPKTCGNILRFVNDSKSVCTLIFLSSKDYGIWNDIV